MAVAFALFVFGAIVGLFLGPRDYSFMYLENIFLASYFGVTLGMIIFQEPITLAVLFLPLTYTAGYAIGLRVKKDKY